MIYTTLPPASSRSSYNHLTVRNTNATDSLTVTPNGTDTIDDLAGDMIIYPGNAVTLQSDETSAWARIQSYSLPTAPYYSDLAVSYSLTALWTTIPDLTATALRSGIFMTSAYIPVDVTSGPNTDMAFETRFAINGTPGDIYEDRQVKSQDAFLKVSISGALVLNVNDVLTAEIRSTGGGTSYTLLGQDSGRANAFLDITGPL